MKRKLGGWQRLWVSLSVVYLFFVVVWTGVEFPSKVALSDAEIQSQLSEAHRAEVGEGYRLPGRGSLMYSG